ncbi:MAG: hypothetical protein KC441_00035, partial [Anaerolineales bacterium]|nr:hypothetical protein [Anaerolineales bacterium]
MPPRKTLVQVGLVLLLLTLLFLGLALWPPPGKALGGADVRGLFYPWLDLTRTAVWQGHLPFWHAAQFAGYPFLSNPQVALFYPPTWLAILLPVRIGISWYVVLHVLVTGLGMWLFVHQQTGSRWGAWLAALTWAFSGFTAVRIFAGHMGLLATFAWLPWLLWAFTWCVVRPSVWTAVLAGIPFGLAILAGHTTSLLYVGLVWAAWALYLGMEDWRLETGDSASPSPQSPVSSFMVARQFLIAALVGLLLSGIQFLPLAQFALESSRSGSAGFDFASAYSFPPAHLVTLLVPEFFGEPTHAGYWSVPNFEELTYYAGVLALLAVILAARRPSRRALFYLAMMAFGLLLAFGSYAFLYRLFYNLLPPFRLARAPGRAAVIYLFAAAALLGEVAGSRRAWERPALDRLLRWVLASTAVLGLAVIAATGAVFIVVHPTDTSGRLWHQVGGWATAVLLLLVGGVLLWRFLAWPQTAVRQRRVLGLALAALVLVDLWTFGYKFIRLEEMAPDRTWYETQEVIGTPTERLLPWGMSIFEQNGAWQVGFNSVLGYNALEIGANQAFIGSIPDPRSTAYDILNTRYVVAQLPLDQFTEGERPLTFVGHVGDAWVYERARVLPLARLVSRVEVIEDEKAAIARIHEPDFDPAATAILAAPPPCELADGAAGTAVISEQRDGYWRIDTDSAGAA